MNKARRKALDRAIALLDEAREIVDTAESEERDYFDDMPDGIQSSDKGQKAGAAADALDEARDAIDDAKDKIGEAV